MLTLRDVVDFRTAKSPSRTISIVHEWNEPDREGFDKLLSAPLLQLDDAIIIDTGRIDKAQVRRYISKYGATDTQKYFNHIHLLPRCNDVSIQRQWAFELIDAFRRKVEDLDQDSCLIGEVRDDGCDTEVTFWVVKKESPPQSAT